MVKIGLSGNRTSRCSHSFNKEINFSCFELLQETKDKAKNSNTQYFIIIESFLLSNNLN